MRSYHVVIRHDSNEIARFLGLSVDDFSQMVRNIMSVLTRSNKDQFHNASLEDNHLLLSRQNVN